MGITQLSLRTENITHSICRQLGVAIITGHYVPQGDFPTEAELCEKFQVSRSAMREAVKMLSAKGLLVSRQRRGTRVQPASDWNMLDPDILEWLQQSSPSLDLLREFNQMRMAIEPEAGALLAQSGEAAGIAALGAAVERMHLARLGEDDPLDSDIAFHVALLEGCGNRFFRQMAMLTRTALQFSIRLTNSQKGVDMADYQSHKNIYEAVCAGDAMLVRELLTNMLLEVESLINSASTAAGKRAAL